MELETIKDLVEKIKSGEIKEKELLIMIDNHDIGIYLNEKPIYIKEFKDLYAIEALLKLVFPTAQVDWD